MSTNEKSFSRGAPKVNRFSEPSFLTEGNENNDEANTIVAAGPKSASSERARAVKNRVFGAPANALQAKHVPPAAFAANRASAAPLEDARLVPMTFLTGENPSDTKLNANNALKTSSVKRVQYLINPDALNDASTARYLCGASWSLDSVRTASKSKKRPLATSSDGHESRRWRKTAAAPRDAEIAQRSPAAAPRVHR